MGNRILNGLVTATALSSTLNSSPVSGQSHRSNIFHYTAHGIIKNNHPLCHTPIGIDAQLPPMTSQKLQEQIIAYLKDYQLPPVITSSLHEIATKESEQFHAIIKQNPKLNCRHIHETTFLLLHQELKKEHPEFIEQEKSKLYSFSHSPTDSELSFTVNALVSVLELSKAITLSTTLLITAPRMRHLANNLGLSAWFRNNLRIHFDRTL